MKPQEVRLLKVERRTGGQGACEPAHPGHHSHQQALVRDLGPKERGGDPTRDSLGRFPPLVPWERWTPGSERMGSLGPAGSWPEASTWGPSQRAACTEKAPGQAATALAGILEAAALRDHVLRGREGRVGQGRGSWRSPVRALGLCEFTQRVFPIPRNPLDDLPQEEGPELTPGVSQRTCESHQHPQIAVGRHWMGL